MNNNQTFKVKYCNEFAQIDCDDQSQVFQIIPKIFNDNRGYFTEVLSKNDNNTVPKWMQDFSWLSQINRSSSAPGVCRGLHAQRGKYCQSKLVECLHGLILDIIVDARPDSKTFKRFDAFILDSVLQNKLFVPKGFLHGFYSLKKDLTGRLINDNNVFQYFVGGGNYNKDSEVNVNMSDVMKSIASLVDIDEMIQSDKDCKTAIPMESFFDEVQFQYKKTGELWYR